MFLIVGLGNPGDYYKKTRHNVGFILLDLIAEHYDLSWNHKTKFNSYVVSGAINGHKVILCKPTTFMNLSGGAVSSLMSFYKIDLKHLIVIHDDIDLELGQLKCKIGGGSGGHNGLKSIDNNVGAEYCRIRIGVGKPDKTREDVSSYVLNNFSDEEMSILHKKYQIIMKNLELLFSFDIEKLKSKLSE